MWTCSMIPIERTRPSNGRLVAEVFLVIGGQAGKAETYSGRHGNHFCRSPLTIRIRDAVLS